MVFAKDYIKLLLNDEQRLTLSQIAIEYPVLADKYTHNLDKYIYDTFKKRKSLVNNQYDTDTYYTVKEDGENGCPCSLSTFTESNLVLNGRMQAIWVGNEMRVYDDRFLISSWNYPYTPAFWK